MNISALGVLGSVITYHPVSEDHLLYIGMGIGLSSGLLCAIVILHYKYFKFKFKANPPICHHYTTTNPPITPPFQVL